MSILAFGRRLGTPPHRLHPTTGVVVGRELYYIANSQFASFDADGALYPMERLFETVVLRLSF